MFVYFSHRHMFWMLYESFRAITKHWTCVIPNFGLSKEGIADNISATTLCGTRMSRIEVSKGRGGSRIPIFGIKSKTCVCVLERLG